MNKAAETSSQRHEPRRVRYDAHWRGTLASGCGDDVHATGRHRILPLIGTPGLQWLPTPGQFDSF